MRQIYNKALKISSMAGKSAQLAATDDEALPAKVRAALKQGKAAKRSGSKPAAETTETLPLRLRLALQSYQQGSV